MQWTEEEFNRVAPNTRLSTRTLNACRAVLVDGRPGKEVSEDLKIVHPQISRGIRVLEKAAAELSEAAKIIGTTQETLKAYAVQEARLSLGEGVAVRDAQPGGVYEGPPVLKTPGFLVQKVGRDAVIHDLGKLEYSPNMNAWRLEVIYPKDGRLASVAEKQPEQSRGGRGR